MIKATVYNMIDKDSRNGREYTMTYLLQRPLLRVYSPQTGWGLNSNLVCEWNTGKICIIGKH